MRDGTCFRTSTEDVHAWQTNVSHCQPTRVRRAFRVQAPASKVPDSPLVPMPQPMNSSESDGLPTPHFPLQTQGLGSQVTQIDDACSPLAFTAAPQPKRLRSPPRPLPGTIERVAISRRRLSGPAGTDAL